MAPALQAVLQKEHIVRLLYLGEVAWLLLACQSRALGKRILAPEGQPPTVNALVQGIDWSGLTPEGEAQKPELLQERVMGCEPSDSEPPGAAALASSGVGVAGRGHRRLQGAAGRLQSRRVRQGLAAGLMMGVGGAGCLGAVWRCPPLALAEFTTSPTELLQAQAARAAALLTALAHNQVLLDWVTRKLDRRRRVLMWRAAAVEGRADGAATDMIVGAPPGHYAHALYQPTNRLPISAQLPLLADPPLPRHQQYMHMRRAGHTRAENIGGNAMGGSLPGSAATSPDRSSASIREPSKYDLLDARGMADLRMTRRRLVESVSPLWLDLAALQLELRGRGRKAFVAGMLANAEQQRASGALLGRTSTLLSTAQAVGGKEEDWVRLEAWEEVYLPGLLVALRGPALRCQLAGIARCLALTVLGCSGGKGHNWGLKFTSDGRELRAAPEYGPFFADAGGADALMRLLQDVGPLWQDIDFRQADKAGDPDPMCWTPPEPGSMPPGLLLPDVQGCLRLDHMWRLPPPLDVLAWGVLASSEGRPHSPHSRLTSPLAGPPVPKLQEDGVKVFTPLGLSQPATGQSGAGGEGLGTQGRGAHTPGDGGGGAAAAAGSAVGREVGGALRRQRTPPAPVSVPQPGGLGSGLAANLGAVSPSNPRHLRLGDSSPTRLAAGPAGGGSGGAGPWVALGSDQVAALEHGCALGFALLGLMRCALLQASLVAPALHLAQGGDFSRQLVEHPVAPETRALGQSQSLWPQQQYLSGAELLEHSGGVARARLAPFLPGALLAPRLTALHTLLAYLVQPKRLPGKGAQGAQASARVPMGPALALLQRQLALAQLQALLAVLRARDGFAAAAHARGLEAWALAAPLEHSLAQGLWDCCHPACSRLLSGQQLSSCTAALTPMAELMPLAALRLADAERLMLHNEWERVQLLSERVRSESRVALGVLPLEALALEEAVAAALWAHDRLRDAWALRALVVSGERAGGRAGERAGRGGWAG
ncbi:hypothetical protein V8C86DRAFT_3093844 [Haematococcus lacustris]